jgi:hypothetical protein
MDATAEKLDRRNAYLGGWTDAASQRGRGPGPKTRDYEHGFRDGSLAWAYLATIGDDEVQTSSYREGWKRGVLGPPDTRRMELNPAYANGVRAGRAEHDAAIRAANGLHGLISK